MEDGYISRGSATILPQGGGVLANESHILHYLLPSKRDTKLISRLRSAKIFPTVRARTSRFKNSFIP